MIKFHFDSAKHRPAIFLAWTVSPMFHTGLWFLWQTTMEALYPLSDAYIRRPEWYAFIIISTWLTILVRFFYVRIWRNK